LTDISTGISTGVAARRQTPVSEPSTTRVDVDLQKKFFADRRKRAVYDRFMKLIGRKTVKGGKVSAPKVKSASSNGKAAVDSGSEPSYEDSGSEPSHEDIAARAYELYLARGSLDGYSEEDWLLAEAELRRK